MATSTSEGLLEDAADSSIVAALHLARIVTSPSSAAEIDVNASSLVVRQLRTAGAFQCGRKMASSYCMSYVRRMLP